VELNPSSEESTPIEAEEAEIPETFVCCRRELISVLVKDRCSFHTIVSACKSTHRLVQRLIAEQTAGTVSIHEVEDSICSDGGETHDKMHASLPPTMLPTPSQQEDEKEDDRHAFLERDADRQSFLEHQQDEMNDESHDTLFCIDSFI